MEHLESLCFEDMQEVGQGFHAIVKRASVDLVVKMTKGSARGHHDNEKKIYERLDRHPALLRCYGELTVDSLSGPLVGLLFDYMAGGRLQELLTDPNRPLQTRDRRERYVYQNIRRSRLAYTERWCLQLTEGLAYVHSKNIVHGDLGAHNILVRESGELKIADFGGSRIDGSSCLAGPAHRYKRLGKDVCLQNNNYAPTEKDDIFALGILLYELAMYTQIYASLSRPEVVELLVCRDFPTLEAIESPDVRTSIRKCWDEEYEDANGVLEDLHALTN